jgi:hypothetical protein
LLTQLAESGGETRMRIDAVATACRQKSWGCFRIAPLALSNFPCKVMTPGQVTLSKGSSALPISCTKQCYVTGASIIPSNTETMAAGNVVFGGLIGLGVDAASGAMNKYPDIVTGAHS